MSPVARDRHVGVRLQGVSPGCGLNDDSHHHGNLRAPCDHSAHPWPPAPTSLAPTWVPYPFYHCAGRKRGNEGGGNETECAGSLDPKKKEGEDGRQGDDVCVREGTRARGFYRCAPTPCDQACLARQDEHQEPVWLTRRLWAEPGSEAGRS